MKCYKLLPYRQVAHAQNLTNFKGKNALKTSIVARSIDSNSEKEVMGPRDDDVLPDSLTDALSSAAEATALAIQKGNERCIAEILLAEFWDPDSGPVYAEEGDQQRFWKLTKKFIDDLVEFAGEGAVVRAIYPDAGVAAMLKNQWMDASFNFGSLNDRKPVQPDDTVIVLAAPDPPGLSDVMRITKSLSPGQSIIMFNPRLQSGDIGLGLTARRMRDSFLAPFVTTYSLRPVGDVGSVFRRWPGLWQVFIQDPQQPGRYLLTAERPARPAGEALDIIIMQALGENGSGGGEDSENSPSFVAQVGFAMRSVQRFMKALS